jgi:hypothetical protein
MSLAARKGEPRAPGSSDAWRGGLKGVPGVVSVTYNIASKPPRPSKPCSRPEGRSHWQGREAEGLGSVGVRRLEKGRQDLPAGDQPKPRRTLPR